LRRSDQELIVSTHAAEPQSCSSLRRPITHILVHALEAAACQVCMASAGSAGCYSDRFYESSMFMSDAVLAVDLRPAQCTSCSWDVHVD